MILCYVLASDISNGNYSNVLKFQIQILDTFFPSGYCFNIFGAIRLIPFVIVSADGHVHESNLNIGTFFKKLAELYQLQQETSAV